MDVDLVILLLRSNSGKMITIDQIMINSVAAIAIIITLMTARLRRIVMERHMSCRLYQLIIGTMWHSTPLKIIINTTVHLMN